MKRDKEDSTIKANIGNKQTNEHGERTHNPRKSYASQWWNLEYNYAFQEAIIFFNSSMAASSSSSVRLLSSNFCERD